MLKGLSTDLSDADLCFSVLESFLDDAEQSSGRHEGSVDVRLADVALNAEGVRRVRETCNERYLSIIN